MKVSTRGEYGVRAMFDLTLNYGTGPIPLKEIARRQLISKPTWNSSWVLCAKQDWCPARGVRREAMSCPIPEQITIGQIIRVLEGPITPLTVWIQTQATALTADSLSSACSATCGRNCRTA